MGIRERHIWSDARAQLRALAPYMAALALILDGCGSSHTTRSTTARAAAAQSSAAGQGPAASPAHPGAFIARAEAICARLNSEFAARRPESASLTEIAHVSPARAVQERDVVDELDKLTAPPTLARAWRRILGYRLTLARELSELGRVAKARDVAAVTALTKSKARMHAQLLAVASRAGFRECARVG